VSCWLWVAKQHTTNNLPINDPLSSILTLHAPREN
jgi:hypothetical protein